MAQLDIFAYGSPIVASLPNPFTRLPLAPSKNLSCLVQRPPLLFLNSSRTRILGPLEGSPRPSPPPPKWEAPYQVILTTSTTAKLLGIPSWIHLSRLKKAMEPTTLDIEQQKQQKLDKPEGPQPDTPPDIYTCIWTGDTEATIRKQHTT